MIPEKYIEIIKSGGVVAFPTETVYGLGADAWNPSAIQKVFNTKGRPSDNPLIVHIADLQQVSDFVEEIPELAQLLMNTFWPGPITLVLKKKPTVLDAISAGLDSVAIRMPSHPLAIEFISKTGPLVAPSANTSGKPSPTKAEHVFSDFGDSVPIIDGGSTEVGLESTVLDLTSVIPTILRPGFISKEEIELVIKQSIKVATKEIASPKSPGQKYSHYKPKAAVHWLDDNSELTNQNTLYLLQDAELKQSNIITYKGDLALMAKEIYDRFRQADIDGFQQILIEPLHKVSAHPLHSALQNRIEKAVGE